MRNGPGAQLCDDALSVLVPPAWVHGAACLAPDSGPSVDLILSSGGGSLRSDCRGRGCGGRGRGLPRTRKRRRNSAVEVWPAVAKGVVEKPQALVPRGGEVDLGREDRRSGEARRFACGAGHDDAV